MSAYAIVGREVAKTVAACLRNRNIAEDPVWIADRGQGATALEEATRVPADLLILDINTGPGLGLAVLRYRLARPRTRVILLAPGKVPGDPEVAGVVQAGVYDVVTDLDGLKAVLDRPQASLAAAALWLDPSLAPGFSSREQVRERIVERRVAVSQRPVLIVVAGVTSGVGTTTVACTLAGYLARRGHRTVLAEAGEQRSLAVIADMDLDNQPAQWLPNLDVCIEPTPRNLVRLRRHAYVVADLGAFPRAELAGVDADQVLVVLPQAHRILRAVAWLKAGKLQPKELYGLRYVVTGEGKSAAKLANTWKEICSKTIPGTEVPTVVNLLPVNGQGQTWPPGYCKGSGELDRACNELLVDLLPDSPREVKWPWLLFRRRKAEG